jgi:hypothetical protein
MDHPIRTGLFTLALSAGVAVAAAVIPGCYAETDPDIGYADITAAPVDVAVSPAIVYAGHPTYYAGGRWWYRDGGGRWAYYRHEPRELVRRRPVVRGAVRGDVEVEHRR